MKLKYTSLFGFGLAIMLLSISCQSETELTIATLPVVTMMSIATVQPSLEPVDVSPLPTVTVTVKVEITSTPVPNPTASPTVTPTIATPLPTLATPTIVPVTLTPLSTLGANELETAMAELLANPMNCDVPCWWGAIPDETTVFEIQQFLALYQFEDYYRRDDDRNQIPDYIELWLNEGQFDFRVMYSFQNDILQTVFSERSPPLYEILRRYGEPDEVWLSTVSFMRDGNLSVRLNLVYLQEGMAVGYVVNGDIQDDVVTGCFADKETGRLRLITPNSTTNYKDFSTIFEADRHY
ncbi:MAG TPA: hypothetical protein EYH05_00320, partial [Anaerolineae bacterium]|nr:hypothetical protein [Anaerolineae bacterium]